VKSVRVIVRVAAVVLTIIVLGIGVSYFFATGPSSAYLDQNPSDGVYRFTGTLSGDNDYLLHSFRVNESAVSMRVTLDCGFNDFDLYGARGYTPTEYDYDWRGFNAGGEDLTIDYPDDGIWNVMVHSYSGAGDYALNIDITYE